MGSHILGPLSVNGAPKANGGLSSTGITIGGSTSSATVAVTGSGAFSQDLSAKSIKLTGAQAPITSTLDVTGSCNITGALTVTGSVSMTGYLWAGGLVSASGGKVVNTGQCTWSVAKGGTGLYTITYTTGYPGGAANYIINVTGHGCLACIRGAAYVTNMSFQVAAYA